MKQQNQSKIKLSNFKPNSFLSSDSFFIQVPKLNSFLTKISVKNDLFEPDELLKIMNNKIEILKENIGQNCPENKINILPEFAENISASFELRKDNSLYAQNIQKIIDTFKDEKFTLKSIKDIYVKNYEKNISLMTISRILRYHLGYHFRKTSVKNPKLKENEYIFMGIIFLNIIARAIQIKLNLVFIDEVGFNFYNKNFYTWKKDREIIYGGPKNNRKGKFNAIIAINEEKVLLYDLSSETINSKDFINFMDELILKLEKEKNRECIYILDNAKFHVSKECEKYFESKRIKIITIVPYMSSFNSIELLFRSLKNITYKKNYSSLLALKKEIISLLEEENIGNILKKNLIETFEGYKEYLKNKNICYVEKIKKELLKKKRLRSKKKTK